MRAAYDPYTDDPSLVLTLVSPRRSGDVMFTVYDCSDGTAQFAIRLRALAGQWGTWSQDALGMGHFDHRKEAERIIEEMFPYEQYPKRRRRQRRRAAATQ